MVAVNAVPPEGIDRLRVLVADDHDLYRRGMQVVLGQEDDLEVVGEGRNGAEAVDLAVELVPDVVLMDVRMPVLTGIQACGRIKDLVPSAKILMLTMSDGREPVGTCSRTSPPRQSSTGFGPCTPGTR